MSRYFTTAISYPNGAPHIGHAYEVIATDALARFYRLLGEDVFFLTGTDEHGQKMQKTAEALGISPLDLVEQNTPLFQNMVKACGCLPNRFIRTTDADHHLAAQALWRAMQNDIYKSSYAGWYSVRDEAFYSEEETKLVDGVRVGGQGTPVEWVEEESYFFRLSAFQERLLKHYQEHPEFIQPESRRNEIMRFVEGGLEDLSISRVSLKWGIPVPDDEKHVMYVWVDALTNYLTGVGYPAPSYLEAWRSVTHIIGKDITRFHAVYWPAFLMSAGVPLPKTIFGHGFLFHRGEKMSKSVGNVVDPFQLIETYGVDAFRYFLLRDVPFGQDGSYSHEAIVARMNADLANDLGNLAQRSLSMIYKNCGGNIPALSPLTDEEENFLASVDDLLPKIIAHMDALSLHLALSEIMSVVSQSNQLFAHAAPWALKKTDPERMGAVLALTAEVLRQVAILLQPFIPHGAAKILDTLQIPAGSRSFAFLGARGRLGGSHALQEPQGVFPRYVEE